MAKNVKITTILHPFELLAPHHCRGCNSIGSPLCDCCKKNILMQRVFYCPNCKTQNPTSKCPNCKTLPPIYVIGKRQDLIGKLIHDYKYNSVRALAKPFAEMLNQSIPSIDEKVNIIPLPTISAHIRSRGLDHTLFIAKKFAKLRGPNYTVKKLLIRAQNTIQVGANRQTRLKQAKNAYQLNPKIPIQPSATYILFDDVWTTGSSMKAAIKKLRHAGIKNIVIAVLATSSLD